LFVRFRIRMSQGKWIIHYSLPIFKKQLLLKVKREGIFAGLGYPLT
jgi:hypothetical protein